MTGAGFVPDGFVPGSGDRARVVEARCSFGIVEVPRRTPPLASSLEVVFLGPFVDFIPCARPSGPSSLAPYRHIEFPVPRACAASFPVTREGMGRRGRVVLLDIVGIRVIRWDRQADRALDST